MTNWDNDTAEEETNHHQDRSHGTQLSDGEIQQAKPLNHLWKLTNLINILSQYVFENSDHLLK